MLTLNAQYFETLWDYNLVCQGIFLVDIVNFSEKFRMFDDDPVNSSNVNLTPSGGGHSIPETEKNNIYKENFK